VRDAAFPQSGAGLDECSLIFSLLVGVSGGGNGAEMSEAQGSLVRQLQMCLPCEPCRMAPHMDCSAALAMASNPRLGLPKRPYLTILFHHRREPSSFFVFYQVPVLFWVRAADSTTLYSRTGVEPGSRKRSVIFRPVISVRRCSDSGV